MQHWKWCLPFARLVTLTVLPWTMRVLATSRLAKPPAHSGDRRLAVVETVDEPAAELRDPR